MNHKIIVKVLKFPSRLILTGAGTNLLKLLGIIIKPEF